MCEHWTQVTMSSFIEEKVKPELHKYIVTINLNAFENFDFVGIDTNANTHVDIDALQ